MKIKLVTFLVLLPQVVCRPMLFRKQMDAWHAIPRDVRGVPRAGWQGEGAVVRGERHVRYELIATIILTNASLVSNENIRLKMSEVRKVKQLDQNDLSYSSGASQLHE